MNNLETMGQLISCIAHTLSQQNTKGTSIESNDSLDILIHFVEFSNVSDSDRSSDVD